MKGKNQIRLLFAIGILLSSIAIAFSYVYGSGKSKNSSYAVLMSLDEKVKKNGKIDFLHGSINYKEVISSDCSS